MRNLSLIVVLLAAISCAQAPKISDAKNSKVLQSMTTPNTPKLEELLTKHEDIQLNGDKVAVTVKLDNRDGNVCITAQMRSDKLSDYSIDHWNSRLEIDGHAEKASLKVSPLQLIGTASDSGPALSAAIDVEGCTTNKFSKIESVSLAFKDHRHKVLAQFDWSKPWPATGAASL